MLKTNRNIGNLIIKFALDLREKQVAKYRKHIKNDEAFAVASTLILGYRADLSKETLAAYSKTGTIHALSVSGSHVAIIFFVLDVCLTFLDRKRFLKIFKFILICSLIWSYSLITGLSPSVVRAAIMISIFITAKTFARNKNSYNTLAFAAFCQLIYNPFLIWDVGFQLSYISVFGLIYLQPKIYKWIYVKNKWLNKVWELVAISLSAQLVTVLLCIYYFHQFPVYFLLGNLFISIPLLLIMILGIAVLAPFLDIMFPIFEWIIVTTNLVLKWIADLPYSTFSSVWINLTEIILLSLALGFFVYALAKLNKKFLFASLLTYIGYTSIITYDDWNAVHQKKIIFFTLRKNYAAAFITGHEAILLTDLSKDDRNYQFFIEPALEQSQIGNINFISLKQDTVLHHFVKKAIQIAFNNYNILLID
ncbi:ComEC/Rec2 family competence protein [Pedobacter sp. Leaf250]|uniref:ComEC/Rec2 family competence protein n=1 Tax=Pedobacter sp. Leaf250 TaxID=2876559 RepID=UPI001E47A9CB|nr:ComEC/Rec2 family competence protein [Pedobacter sp. Leaf250]